MAELKKIATRDSYGETLVELGAENPDIVVMDADLAGATKTCKFAAAYPERFFDAGIAEANMIGIAAGLATCGKTVFASSFAMFATGRAYEQIRNSVGYPKLNVKNLCFSRRYYRWRRRSLSPVHRRSSFNARHSGNGGYLPGR